MLLFLAHFAVSRWQNLMFLMCPVCTELFSVGFSSFLKIKVVSLLLFSMSYDRHHSMFIGSAKENCLFCVEADTFPVVQLA